MLPVLIAVIRNDTGDRHYLGTAVNDIHSFFYTSYDEPYIAINSAYVFSGICPDLDKN